MYRMQLDTHGYLLYEKTAFLTGNMAKFVNWFNLAHDG